MTRPVLFIFCGLPACGKTTLAKGLAREIHAAYLRIDSISAGLKESALALEDMKDSGYAVSRRLAADNLGLGLSVVVDTVHWTADLRAEWNNVVDSTGVQHCWIEVVCENAVRRERIERRFERGWKPGETWKSISALRMDPVTDPALRIDTSRTEPAEALMQLQSALRQSGFMA